MNEQAKKYLTVEDMASRYGVSRWTLRNWERAGKIPKADRTRGRPRWWTPAVEQAEKAARERPSL